MSLLSQEPTHIVKESVSTLSRMERNLQNQTYLDLHSALMDESINDSAEKLSILYECDSLDLSILEAIGREPGSISSSIAQNIYTSKSTVLNRSANLEVLGLIERKQTTKGGAYENHLCINLEPLVAHATQEAINSNMLQFNDPDQHNIDWVQQISQCPKKPFDLLVKLFSNGGKTAEELKLISSDSVTVQTIYSRIKTLIALNLVCRQYCDRKARYVYIVQPEISSEAITSCLRMQKFAEVKYALKPEVQMIEGYSNNSNSVASKVATSSDKGSSIPMNPPSFLQEKEDVESLEVTLSQLKTAILETLLIVVSSPQICSGDITDKHPGNLNNSTIHHYLGSLMDLNLVSRSRTNGNGRSQYGYTAIKEVDISMIEAIFSARHYLNFRQTTINMEQKSEQCSTDIFEREVSSNKTIPLQNEILQPAHEESQMDRFIEKLVGKIHNFDNDVDKIATVLEELVGKVQSLEASLERAVATIAQYQVRLEGVESSIHNNPPIYNHQKLDRLIESLK